MNLYDLTQGNYTVHRTVTYPDHPNSQLTFDTRVNRVSDEEWSTTIEMSGTYDAPVDVTGVEDYRIDWTTDGSTLHEEGSATLLLASGGTLRTTWISTITPAEPRFDGFADGGETVRMDFSPFEIEENRMSYEWTGSVAPTGEQAR